MVSSGGAERRPLHIRYYLAICAAVSREKPDSPFSLAEVARLLGLPPKVVWGALARHAHLDALDDLWVVMAPDDDRSDDRTTECLDLSLVHPEWPKQFLGHALRRWPADLIALVADLVAGVWSGDEEGFWPAAQFLAEVIDCIEPDWSMNVFVKGMMRMHGNLAVRASEMPNRGRPLHPDRDLVLQRGLPAPTRASLRDQLARRLLALDLGTLPERILASPSEKWLSAGHLLSVLFNCGLPGVGERLEERLFGTDALFGLLAEMIGQDHYRLESAIELLYGMTSGTEGGARRFVETLRARKGYDLPRPLRTALLQRLSIGIGAIVEAVDTADASLGTEMLAIFRRWREELDTFKWYQTVGCRDSSWVC